MIRSGLIVAFFTLLSRIFGLARESFIVYMFGTSQTADCVNTAFKFPNLFRRIFGEGALSSVFIPIFNEKLLSSREAADDFRGKVFALLLIILITLTIFIQLSMHYVMLLIAPGFYVDNEKFELAVSLCRITTPYLIFTSVTALFGAMLNSVRKFAAFAFTPVIMNICIIVGTYLMRDKYTSHYAISYALIISGFLQVFFILFCSYKADLGCSFKFNFKDAAVNKLIKNMGPATISSGAQQLGLFLSHSIASFIPGAVSILSYADRLYQLPLALIGITFGTILLPELSKIYKNQNYDEANILQNNSIKVALFLSLPATFGLIALAEPIISVIYERGEFSAEDSALTAKVLALFALGLPAYVIAKIITPIFYANLDVRTPALITIYILVINITLNIALMKPYGVTGLAAATSVSAWINSFILYKYSKKFGKFSISKETKYFTLKALIASCAMFTCIKATDLYCKDLYSSDSLLIKSFILFSAVMFGIVIFLLFSYFFRLQKAFYIKKNELIIRPLSIYYINK